MKLANNELSESMLIGYDIGLVEHTVNVFKLNEYDPEENEIHLNGFNDNEMIQVIKGLGNRPIDPLHSLYHEIGHAVVYHEDIAEDTEANEIFGDFDGQYYGTAGLIKSMVRDPQAEKGFITEYAKEHPEEDFCECFAYLLTKGNKIPNLPNIRKDKIIMKKLKYVQSWIKEIWEDFEPLMYEEEVAS